MSRFVKCLIALLFIFNADARAQSNTARLTRILTNSTENNFDSIFTVLEKEVNRLPIDEAIVTVDKLMRTAAQLPHYKTAFNPMGTIAQKTYQRQATNRDFLLYCLSIIDEPEFRKPGIREGLYYYIGVYYYGISYYFNSNRYLKLYLEKPEFEWSGHKINALTTLGLAYHRTKDYTEAAYYHELALKEAQNINDTLWTGIAGGNLAATYFKLGRYAEAEPYLRNDVKISLDNKMYQSAAGALSVIGNIYFNKGDYKKAKQYLDSSLVLLNKEYKETEYATTRATIYTIMADYYAKQQKFDTAFKLYVKAAAIKDTLTQQKLLNEVRTKLNEFNLTRDRQQQQLIKTTIAEKKRAEIILISILLFACIVIGFTVFSIVQKQRINKVLKEKAAIKEKANQAKNKIFSVIGHDLRSPLSSLKNMFDLLADGTMSKEEVYMLLPAVQQSINSLYSSTDSLLNWAHTQMEGMQAKPETVNISKVINLVFMLLEPAALAKNIKLINSTPGNCTAYADINHVEIIIRNLVSNAIKFTPPHGTVTLSTITHNDKVIISVADTGIGITDNIMKTLFTAGNSSTVGTSGERGIGLGLNISRELTATNNGKIWVEKNEPGGSVFKVEMPVN